VTGRKKKKKAGGQVPDKKHQLRRYAVDLSRGASPKKAGPGRVKPANEISKQPQKKKNNPKTRPKKKKKKKKNHTTETNPKWRKEREMLERPTLPCNSSNQECKN